MKRSLASLFFVAACGSTTPKQSPDMAHAPDLAQKTYTFQYVIDTVTLPTNNKQFAADVDGDGGTENAFGGVIGLLKSANFDLQGNLDSTVKKGDGLNLLSLVTTDDSLQKDLGARTTMYTAVNQEPPDFTGSGTYTVDPTVAKGVLTGPLDGSLFLSVDPAGIAMPPTVSIRIQLTPTVSVNMPVVGARLQFQPTVDALMKGQINGGLAQKDINGILIPALQLALNEVAHEMPCVMECTTVKSQFDTNHDGTISLEEVQKNGLVMALLTPDVQLFDDKGVWHPMKGAPYPDSISTGVGFTAVKAAFPE